MSDLPLSQAAEKAYQAEILLALLLDKQICNLCSGEIEAVLVIVKKLTADAGSLIFNESLKAEGQENE